MITETWLKSASGKVVSKPYEKSDRDGLSVRVSAQGKIVWQIRYRFASKPCRLSIGTYPGFTLKQARQKAESLRAELDQGRDPSVVVARQQMARKFGGDTLEELFSIWYQGECVKKRQKPEEVLNSMTLHVFPKYGKWHIGELSLPVWSNIVANIAERTPRIAERVLLASKQMYRYLMRHGRLEGQSPIEHLSASRDFGVVRKTLHRSLTDAELEIVIEAINNSRLDSKNRNLVKLLLMFGCRPKEMRISKKEHFDLVQRVWTVPPENHKTGDKSNQPLLRPITDAAALLIAESIDAAVGSDYLFPGRGTVEPVCDTAMLSIAPNLIKWVEKHRGVKMAHWSLYDFRKTARTNWSRFTQPHIAELMLGHKLPGSWQVYDHYTYLDEQLAALAQWHEKLMRLGLMDRR